MSNLPVDLPILAVDEAIRYHPIVAGNVYVTVDAFIASVIPYPPNVVGLVPALTCPRLSIVTLLYVPGVIGEIG